MVCLSSVWQFPAYQFGNSTATCNATNAGIIRWTGAAFQGCNGATWNSVDAVATVSLSSLLAATTTNSIDSANWAQTWKWGTLSTQTALTLTSSSETSGTVLNVSSGNAAATGYAGYFSQTGTGGYALGTTGPLNVTYSNNNYGSGVYITNSNTGANAPAAVMIVNSANQNAAFLINNASSPSGNSAAIVSNTGLAFNMDNTGANSGALMSFQADGSTYMTLTTTGSVGIGTTNPTTALDVYYSENSYTPGIRLTNSNTGSGASAAIMVTNSSLNGGLEMTSTNFSPPNMTHIWSNTGILFQANNAGTVANANISFENNSTTLMTILSSGNVGIGSTSPQQLLDVAGAAATATVNSASLSRLTRPDNPGIKYANSAEWALGSYSTNINSNTRLDLKLADGATDNPDMTSMTWLGDGYVGIDTTSPTAPLQVNSGSWARPGTSGTAQPGAFLRLYATGGSTFDFGYDTDNGGTAWMQNTKSGDLSQNYALLLNPNGGNVGVNILQPAYALDVLGATTTSGVDTQIAHFAASSSNGGGADIVLENLSTTNYETNIDLYGNGTELWQIENDCSANKTQTLCFYDAVNHAIRLFVTATGSVGIGTTTPGTDLTVGNTNFAYSSGWDGIDIANSASNGMVRIGQDLPHSLLLFWIYNATPGNAVGQIHTYSYTNPIQIDASYVALQSQNTGGFVGIGTTSPTAPLDVVGAIRSEADSYVSSDFPKTSSTSFAAITGLTSGTLAAGKAYAFNMALYTTSSSSGGIKVDLNGGTATATTLIGDSQEWDGTAIGVRTAFSSLSTSLCAITAVATATCQITGTIIVNGAGTLIPRFAQNASNGTASKVKAGSYMLIRQLN